MNLLIKTCPTSFTYGSPIKLPLPLGIIPLIAHRLLEWNGNPSGRKGTDYITRLLFLFDKLNFEHKIKYEFIHLFPPLVAPLSVNHFIVGRSKLPLGRRAITSSSSSASVQFEDTRVAIDLCPCQSGENCTRPLSSLARRRCRDGMLPRHKMFCRFICYTHL